MSDRPNYKTLYERQKVRAEAVERERNEALEAERYMIRRYEDTLAAVREWALEVLNADSADRDVVCASEVLALIEGWTADEKKRALDLKGILVREEEK